MEKTNFITIPSFMREKKLKVWNISDSQWTVYVIFAAIIAGLTFVIFMASGFLQVIAVALTLGILYIFFKYFRQESVLKRTETMFSYWKRKKAGDTEIMKYVERDYQKIKDSLSILKIEDGLIHWEKNHYSTLFRYTPPTINGSSLWPYITQTIVIVDSLLESMLLKIFVVSIGHDPIQYKKELLEASNKTKSKPEQDHLVSVHNQLEDKKDRSPRWEFYGLLDYGKYNTYEEAVVASDYWEGFRDRLEQCGIKSKKVISEDEILFALHNAVNPIHPLEGN